MRVDFQSETASIHLSLRLDKCLDRDLCLTDDCLFALSVIKLLSFEVTVLRNSGYL